MMAMDERHLRGWEILNPGDLTKNSDSISLIGAGGIGSHTGLMLARMGLPFTVFDGDTVEEHNISNQLYPPWLVGQNKAVALYNECLRSGMAIVAVPEFYQNQSLGTIVISGLDSQEARTRVFGEIRRQGTRLYIDGRMGGEVVQIYALDPSNIAHVRRYNTKLRARPDQDPCTARAIAYNLSGVACFTGKLLQSYLKNGEITNEVYLDLRTFALVTNVWE